MSDIFLEIIKTSIFASLLACIILVLRCFIKNKWSARFICIIWLVFVIRLCLPISIPTTYLFFTMPPIEYTSANKQVKSAANVTALLSNISKSTPNSTTTKNTANSATRKSQNSNQPIPLWDVLSKIWFFGMMILLSLFVFTYIKTYYRLRKDKLNLSDDLLAFKKHYSIDESSKIMLSEHFHKPFTFGVINPVIVLPKDSMTQINKENLSYIIQHEKHHIKKQDSLKNIILYVLNAVYWFNPIVWIAIHELQNDMEIACDEAVTRKFTPPQKIDYAKSIVSYAIGKQKTPLSFPSFSEKNIKNRVKHIMIQRKNSILPSILAIFVIFCLSIITLTSSVVSKNENYNTSIYKNLPTILKYETKYVGNVSADIRIIGYIPLPDPYHVYNHIGLSTSKRPYDLNIYYSLKDKPGDPSPFFNSKMENNALILFSAIQNVDTVTFTFCDKVRTDQDSKNYNSKYIFKRVNLQKKFNIDNLKKNSSNFIKALNNNLAIDEERPHYNRIRWGSDQKWVTYRNGEPTSIKKLSDGSTMLSYQNLGEVTSQTKDGKTKIDSPGNTVEFYLNSPKVIKLDNLTGVYKMVVSKGDSELLWNCNLKSDSSYEQVIKNLGNPIMTKTQKDKSKILYYPVFNKKHYFVFFTFSNEKMINHGITVDCIG